MGTSSDGAGQPEARHAVPKSCLRRHPRAEWTPSAEQTAAASTWRYAQPDRLVCGDQPETMRNVQLRELAAAAGQSSSDRAVSERYGMMPRRNSPPIAPPGETPALRSSSEPEHAAAVLVGLASGRRRHERLGLPVEEGNTETVLRFCTRRVMPGCVRLICAEAATIDPVSTTATNASRSSGCS